MASAATAMVVFDRALVRRHRDRASASWEAHDFLFRHAADLLVDRLDDVTRSFACALDLGCHDGMVAHHLATIRRIADVYACDLSGAMARRAVGTGVASVAADEEMLPFGPASFDLITSNLSLHWTNDLPGALLQARLALKPDGLFIATMLGGDTLVELRRAVMETELALTGGASPRLSPLTDIRDAGALLQRAGFALPVVDVETVTVTYDSLFKLVADLRGMGETNAVVQRNPATPPRRFWPEAAERYHTQFAESDGRIPATFQILTLTGWAPHESQQTALRPGSASARLAGALGTTEHSAGDKAGRQP